MTCIKLIGNMPLWLVYRQEVVIPMEYIVSSLRIVVVIDMANSDMMNERMSQILVLEEDKFILVFHQQV